MKILRVGDVVITSDGVFRYNAEDKCMEKVPFCDENGDPIQNIIIIDDPK